MKHLPDERLNKGLLFGAYAMLIVSTILSFYLIFNKEMNYPLILIILNLLFILIAFVYFLKGYTKDSAKYFKFAMLFKASTYIINYIYLAFNNYSTFNTNIYITFAIMLIIYGNTLFVGIANDLKKIPSFLIYGSNICLFIINMFVSFDTNYASQIASIIWILLSLVCLIMIEAKYIDKGNRSAL